MASSNRNSGNFDWGSWIPIIVLFCIPTPVTWIIAFCMLVSRLAGMRGKLRGQVKRHPYDIQQGQQHWENVSWDETAPQGAPAGQSGENGGNASQNARNARAAQSAPRADARAADPAAARPKAKSSAAPAGRKKPERGRGGWQIIVGAVLTAVFGLSTAAATTEMLRSIFYGYFFSDELIGVLACAMFLGGSIGLLCSGIGKNRRQERYMNYLAYIGANREVSLAHMAATFDVPVRKLCKDLRRMLSKGILPTGYLDLAEGKLFLTEMGYRAPGPKAEPEKEPAARAAAEEDAILREIRQVNDDIPDEVMSEKIDRIEEITGKILAYQKSHPNREGQLRSFLNYYLPTTLKILRAYAQLDAQGIEGENISAAKARIEGMMDQVVAGFERQLDKLFQNDALDVASDVEVLENMLKKDGLSDGEGMTLGM